MVTLTRAPQPRRTKETGKDRSTGNRRTLVVLLAVLVVAGMGAIAWLLLRSSDDSVPLDLATLPSPRSSASASASASASGSASSGAGSSTGTAGSSGTGGSAGTSGRNPFGVLAGSGVGSSATTPATAPTQAPSATSAPTGSSSTATTSPTPTVTRTATRTTTVTVTAATVYVGLYGWTAADLPMLRVNESAVTPAAGETFAPSLVYVSRFTSGSDTCANITYEGNPKSLCPGDVQKLT